MKEADRLPWAEYCAICDSELDEDLKEGLGKYLCLGCNHYVCVQCFGRHTLNTKQHALMEHVYGEAAWDA
jgi:hypothetical protein